MVCTDDNVDWLMLYVCGCCQDEKKKNFYSLIIILAGKQNY